MTGWQKLPRSIEALNHKMRLACTAQAPNHRRQLTKQWVMRRRNPHPFDRTTRNLITMMAGFGRLRLGIS
jgi:hypothetical protein